MGKGSAAGVTEYRESLGKGVLQERDVKSKRKALTSLPTYTREEVAKHNTKEDLWIIIYDKIYDLSAFVDNHPGGYLPLVNVAGKDATDNFINYHPAYVWERKLPYMIVGQIPAAETQVSPMLKEYRDMRQTLLKSGMFETRYTYYYGLVTWLLALFSTMVYLTVFCESLAAHLFGAVMLGIFYQQIAFIGHDLGHNGITHDHKTDSMLGLLCGNLLMGVSMGWWKWSHNTHHNVCNSVENDPDVQYLPLFAVSNKFFTKFYSTFHRKVFNFDGVARFLVGYQHYLYYPVMMLARLNLYAQSFIFIYNTKVPTVNKKHELAALAVYYSWLGLLIGSLPSWEQRLAFFLLSNAVSGILHVQICVSHFCMATYSGFPQTGDDRDSWPVLQLATTLDVTNPWYMEWFHGGLQYQIEHHLFPRVPRHNLSKLRPLVQSFCKKYGIKYQSAPFFEANALLYGALAKAAKESRTAAVDKTRTVSAIEEFQQSALCDGLFAIG